MVPSSQRNACLSCRQRKLKCDRQQPCANCVARSVDCAEQDLPPNRAVKRPLPQEANCSALSSILSRLDQIETYLSPTKRSKHVSISTPIGKQLNAIRFNVPSVSQPQEPASNNVAESMTLEDQMQATKYSVNDSFLYRALTHELSISISADYKSQKTIEPRHIQLPPKWETMRLFQVYFQYLGHVQNIIYEPHARILVDEAYDQIVNISATTAPRGLALMLSVIALATILEPVDGNLTSAIAILKERLVLFAAYIRMAMDCLEQHRRRADHTLENVQALILLSFGIHHTETFSPRYRVLLAEAIAVSHSLGLHVVDRVPVRRGHSKVDGDPVTQEIKRRVWWYLAATDWASSKAEGTSGATYLIQPNLISTNLPKHINDTDINNPEYKERPLSEPTTMSYNIQRIKVAEIVRCISDLMPPDPGEASCELILTLDAKMESLLCELPDFFKAELAESEETKQIDQSYPHIPVQRLLINLLINIFRCGLHFPYLPGRVNKTLHAFSRQASLKAARVVLSSQRGMSMTDMSHSADFMKIQGTIFHMFIGALVLTTDICCNQDGQTQLYELMEVLKKLDNVKDHSKMAAKLLDVLTQLLVTYGIWSPSTTVSTYTEDVTPLDYDTSGHEGPRVDSLDMPFPFDELWETYIGQPCGLDMLDVLDA
ncbi:putative transcription factor lepB [Fusarium oxysporum f. sp. raphani]|uniref:Putative transcription factor lepB n=1 Tax=Fusarium oxysporum f. sp. raphani TaxID=96318 RepID=A0A8J5UTQ6_FUSOX|nr:putative transcription factor lepB [Fusarium oxysporum f. sp. raphani]WKT38247.1 Zn(2)-C6 fungal-type DNA-binding domain [Fusarium oxysporum f. sp. vasinfectum]